MAILDHNGQTLGIGDKIEIDGVLTVVNQNTRDFINCIVTLAIPPPPPPLPGTTVLDLNTRQVELTTISGTILLPPIDEFGRPVNVGDSVRITGTVVGVDDGAPFNIFVELDVLMPPSGTRIRIPLNSTQVELIETALTQRRLLRLNEQIGQWVQPFRELYE
jgi:hypothetical protein